MSHRQFADLDGHRWDVEDEGPVDARPGRPEDETEHQLRFRRDDGTEHIRTAPRSLDRLADAELRAVLASRDPDRVERGPDTAANRSRGYGDASD
jgi:hypothetical protein